MFEYQGKRDDKLIRSIVIINYNLSNSGLLLELLLLEKCFCMIGDCIRMEMLLISIKTRCVMVF